ncbi:MAG TPA: hypothetical protein VMU28_03185 [Terriglobales bacterium]|nr:hypothetical protein [Terriglobales bacterium]
MFHGTTIDELLEIVERAEDHAHDMQAQSGPVEPMMYPGFLAEMANVNQEWLGVA